MSILIIEQRKLYQNTGGKTNECKGSKKIIGKLRTDLVEIRSEYEQAFDVAIFALIHKQTMERIADLEATPEKVTLTLQDILYIRNEAQVFERLLHHLPDDIVDHIGFICDTEMKDRYARREKIEKECEA